MFDHHPRNEGYPEASRNQEKRRLARGVVAQYHGRAAAEGAEERFDRVHRERAVPDDVPEVPIPADAIVDGKVWLPRLLAATGLAESNADGRRQIEQGAVRVDGVVVTDPDPDLDPSALAGRVVQVGRRRFLRLSSTEHVFGGATTARE